MLIPELQKTKTFVQENSVFEQRFDWRVANIEKLRQKMIDCAETQRYVRKYKAITPLNHKTAKKTKNLQIFLKLVQTIKRKRLKTFSVVS